MLVDPDGREAGIDGVYINEEGKQEIKTFLYAKGEDGEFGFYYEGQKLNSEFADMATEAIGELKQSIIGSLVVSKILKNKNVVKIVPTKNADKVQTFAAKNTIMWKQDGFLYGDLDVPSYISLGHEFAHQLAYWYGFNDYTIWEGTTLNDDKWACSVENWIRRECDLEIRKSYNIDGSCPIDNSVIMGAMINLVILLINEK